MTNAQRIMAALLAVIGVVLISTSTALAHRGRVFGPAFGEPGSGAGQLSLESFTSSLVATGGSGLAVDEVTHDVYVADTGNNRVSEFTSAGVFVQAWGWGVLNGAPELQVCTEMTGCRTGLSGTSPGEFESPAFIAVDNSIGGEGDVYVANYRQGDEGGGSGAYRLVQKFTANGALIESWGSKGQIDESPAEHFQPIQGIAVKPSGELLVGTNSGIFTFAQVTGSYISSLNEPEGHKSSIDTFLPSEITVDGSGNIYFEEDIAGGVAISKYGSSGVLVGYAYDLFARGNGIPDSYATGIGVSRSGELYVDEGDAIRVVSPGCVSFCVPITTFSSPLLTEGAGLAVDSQSEAVYIAEVAGGKIESIVPEPPAAPAVEPGSQTVSDVSGDSATLEAEVNPRSEPNEEPTLYYFQYTTDESFQREGFSGAVSIPVPDGQLAANYEADLVTFRLQGLPLGTVYHYRVVAENAISRKEGKPTAGEQDESGKEVARTFTTQPQGVFALPDGRTWELVSPVDKRGALIESLENGSTVQASTDGDAFTYLATAPTEAEPQGNSNLTQVLSTRATAGATSWASQDISTPREFANGLELGPEEYRFFSSDLSSSIVDPLGVFDPAISAEATEQTALLRNDFPKSKQGELCSSSCYRALVTGASGIANVPEGTEFGEGQCDTGKTQKCGPRFIGASPDASHIVLGSKVALTEGAPAESLYEWAGGQLQLVSVLPDGEPYTGAGALGNGAVGEIDGNGRNAISRDGSRVVWSANGKALYLRDTVSEETVELGGTEAEFQTANSDDTRVFYMDAGDLLEFEVPAGAALSTGHATNLTPSGGAAGVLDVSSSGATAYFVATSVLTGGEANEHGEQAVAGQLNLYVEVGGITKFVAVLANKDSKDWHGAKTLDEISARVSSSGGWLAFMSERSLTGYDNRDVSSGERDEEVFLYDLGADGGRGGLVCASCDPTGARPHGVFDADTALTGSLLVDKGGDWEDKWIAGSVPGWTTPLYQSRYLSDSGRLFFDSADALVASDTNGVEDVYQYEPPGVGSCVGESATFSVHSGGCVDLISSGTSKEESAFLDASENGDDVFFLSSAQLSKKDLDLTPDVYDARVDGGFPGSQAPPACEGDACQSPVAAPNDPTPGSLTYQGPGNPVPLLSVGKPGKKKVVKCQKGKYLVHSKCVKVKKAKRTARHANKRRVK